MPKLPDPVHEHTTATAVVRWYEKNAEQGGRPHLGASIIGRACERAIWYSFRWASDKKFSGRMLRLFATGHREEARFLAELRGIGAEVYDRDDNGEQHRFSAVRGHFGGSCDAIARGLPEAPKTWAVVEMKTHNDDSFKQLLKVGMANSKPEHFIQMQIYMGLAELERGLYIACNKNTDEIHTEWIHFERDVFERYIAKAEKIIDAEVPPERVNNDPAWYVCKMCDHHAICHADAVPIKSCRTCVHATAVDEGQWGCQHHERLIPLEEQRLGCRSHLYIPPLINYAEPLDAGEGWIKYKHRDGAVFANVTEDCDRSEENMTNDITACFTSAEMAVTMPQFVSDPMVADIKKLNPSARVVSCTLTDDDIPF